MHIFKIFQDERNKPSMARLILTAWTLNCGALMWLHPDVSNAVWAINGSIETALIAWAAGPRIAQYIGPQIGAVGAAIGQAVRKGRDPELGVEPTQES